MGLAAAVYTLVMKTGGPGLLVLGILDSSYLFAPWGNDLMMVALVARNPHAGMMVYYAVMSTVGSVVGCLLLDLTLRPLGEKGLEKHLSQKRLARVRDKIKRSGGTGPGDRIAGPTAVSIHRGGDGRLSVTVFPQAPAACGGRLPPGALRGCRLACAALRKEHSAMGGKALV